CPQIHRIKFLKQKAGAQTLRNTTYLSAVVTNPRKITLSSIFNLFKSCDLLLRVSLV
ncbi:hypothetical protein PACTADRAFT_19086, partial [Pachysolen tannophilus NRRL Y-2460]